MINYIILGHKNPQQIRRLIERLYTKNSFFYIHIDINEEIKDFIKEVSDYSRITFLTNEQRYSGLWGDLGIVKATIAALRQIIFDRRSGYCILLSGQDYPLKDSIYIENFFDRNDGMNFISIFPLPSDNWNDKGIKRINYYKINRSLNRGDFVQLPSVFEKDFYNWSNLKHVKSLLSLGKYVSLFKVLRKRKFPEYLKPYGGDQWWALPIATIKQILGFIDEHPGYLGYHKYSLLPDEMFFQSIFMSFNSKEELLPYQRSITYVNWSRKNVILPVTFTQNDIDELSHLPEDKLFARKFDIEIDDEILNLLDRRISERI